MTAALQRIVDGIKLPPSSKPKSSSQIPENAQGIVNWVAEDVSHHILAVETDEKNDTVEPYQIQVILTEDQILSRIGQIMTKLQESNMDMRVWIDMYYELRADIMYGLLEGYLKYQWVIATELTIIYALLFRWAYSKNKVNQVLDHKLDKLWVHFCWQDIKLHPDPIERMKTIDPNGTAKEYCEAIDQNIS